MKTNRKGNRRFVFSRALRSEFRGLSIRQRAFLREKVLGSNDKEAALAAGYSTSVAKNTKQKIWAKPGIRVEFERLRLRFVTSVARGFPPTTPAS